MTQTLVEDPFGSVWTTVYQAREGLYCYPSIFACLADPTLECEILQRTDWLRHAESFNPGFTETGYGVFYENGHDDGFDFLVKAIYFHSLQQWQFHVSQEFVFLFSLFREKDGSYYAIDKCGRKEQVVDVDENVIKFRTSYLMRYMAARQMLYVQFIDSRRSSSPNYPMRAENIGTENHQGDVHHYEIWYQSTESRDYLFSMLYARSIVRPDDVSKCKIWPYEDDESEDYPEFAIEELPNGDLERFSCNPDKLGNYFGENPNAPQYLTPVFFSPDVLDRYRGNPNFQVTERSLSCGTQWKLEIDNAISERVMVYLGDLGRDLPASERRHFLDHEISPTGQHISETAVAQDFFCSFDAPMGPVTALFSARCKLDEAWATRFGHPLYRPAHPDENDMEKLIRIPAGNGRQEFDTVILNLTKYCIDYIDESALSVCENGGSINKLESTLRELKIDADIKPLRDLQNVRSSSIAHAKGKNYEKLGDDLLTGDRPRDVARIIERLTDMMNDLASDISAATT